MTTQIILGTANFGNDYGVANKGKLLTTEESKSMTNWAQKNGINHFDTALSYGLSNEVLANNLEYSTELTIDTKLDEKSCQSSKLIVETATNIRSKMGVSELSVLYLHDEEILQSSLGLEISIGLKEVLSRGIAKRIGVSIYSKDAILACKKILPELTVFQVPENICDRRLIASSEIQQLSEENNCFIVRSIFLQGLLLIKPTSIPEPLRLAMPSIETLNNFSERNSITVLDLCLAYAKSISWASGIVVGAASLNQLKEIQTSSALLPSGWNSAISKVPSEIVDPRKWSL